MNIEDLKGLELPVKLKSGYTKTSRRLKFISITAFNKEGLLFVDNDGYDDYEDVSILNEYELAPKTKTVKVDGEIYIYESGAVSSYRLLNGLFIDTIRIKRTYELDENNNIIDIKEG